MLLTSLFTVIFSHEIYFKAVFLTLAFSPIKKFASKVLAMFPPCVKIGLFSIGTFRKFSPLLEKDTRNSEKLLDILQSVSPRLLLSSVSVLLSSVSRKLVSSSQ